MNKTPLSAKIEARNIANAAVLEYTPRILAALQPLVGEMLRTKDGVRSAKLQKMVASLDLPNAQAGVPRVQVLVRADTFWFRAEFNVTVSWDRGCKSESVTVNLGEMDGRTLKSVADAPTAACFPTNFTVEEITAARAAVDSAKDILRAAERRLCFFGESDN